VENKLAAQRVAADLPASVVVELGHSNKYGAALDAWLANKSVGNGTS